MIRQTDGFLLTARFSMRLGVRTTCGGGVDRGPADSYNARLVGRRRPPSPPMELTNLKTEIKALRARFDALRGYL